MTMPACLNAFSIRVTRPADDRALPCCTHLGMLVRAAATDDVALLERAMSEGAEPDWALHCHGPVAFLVAAANGSTAVLGQLCKLKPELLHKAGACFEGQQQQWALKLAVQGGHVEVVRLLLTCGAMCACYHVDERPGWDELPQVGWAGKVKMLLSGQSLALCRPCMLRAAWFSMCKATTKSVSVR